MKSRASGGSAGPGVDTRESPLEVRPPTPDAMCIESRLSSFESDVTPTPEFFVRSHFSVPSIDPERWRLSIEGHVDRNVSLSLAALSDLPSAAVTATLECAGNSRAGVRPRPEGVLWRNGAVGTAAWSGVPLGEVLALAGVRPGAREVVLEGADRGREPGVEGEMRFAMSLPLEKAVDRDTLVATAMNGAPLPARHGFPARAVVPSWYGMASVKWLTRIVVQAAPFEGHFRTRAYAFIPEGERSDAAHEPVTEVRVKSLFTWPREGQILPPGGHRLRGVAWSGAGPIRSVEVAVRPLRPEAGPPAWVAAEVTPGPNRHTWSHWEARVELPTAGFYVLRVRATDASGTTQPETAAWNFRGLATNSIHAVPIEVQSGPTPRDR